MTFPAWVDGIDDRIIGFLSCLQINDQPGRYLHCLKGLTPEGRKASLGFSCFALKIFYTLEHWKKLDEEHRKDWISFIKSFQYNETNISEGSIKINAFIDPVLINYLEERDSQFSIRDTIKNIIAFKRIKNHLSNSERAIIAETKQALATLAEVSELPYETYQSYPKTPNEVIKYMDGFDWSQPWGAGGQTAALSVFFALESPKIMDVSIVKQLKETAGGFYASIADPQTGGYFKDSILEHGSLINGAMKVLTALDWLEVPIHYPDQLIDTCLDQLPKAEGCHLVDAVYVLDRCSQETTHKKNKIIDYCSSVLKMIKAHHNKDGGFSYSIGSAQTSYYGLPISKGFYESDIHGTVLLTWALAMIFKIQEKENYDWKIIRP